MPNKTLQNKIKSIMTGSSKSSAISLATFLYWLSLGYGAFQKLRSACYRKHLIISRKLPCRVISIGNITVGGTGKTPMTIFMTERLRQLGYRVVVVSRGYKGTARRAVTIVSDGQSVCTDPETAGDEPYLLACRLRGIPVMVGKNRFSVGQTAMDRFQPEVIILDDGFQHMQLARDVDLVLLDYHKPFGNRHLLPRGTLREPPSALKRTDAVVVTRSPYPAQSHVPSADPEFTALLPQVPLFSASHALYFYRVSPNTRSSAAQLGEPLVSEFKDIPEFDTRQRVVAFSGIARNDDFRQRLDLAKINVVRFIQFSDHHWYSDRDFGAILQAAEQSAAQCLVTTEKDYARFGHRKTWPLELIVVGAAISFGDDMERFDAFLKNRLAK